MKKINTSIFLVIAALSIALFGSGCYTQLAIMPDEPVISVDPIIIVIHEQPLPSPPPYPHPPPPDPGPPPPHYPPSSIGVSMPGSGTVAETPPPRRESGYQRSGSSDQTRSQTIISDSGTRDGGPRRCGQ